MRMRSVVLVGIGALLAAGCGDGDTEPDKLNGLQEYPSAQALADDLTKHGHTCEFKQTAGGMNTVDSGTCVIDGKEMVLGIYASQSQIDKQIAFIESVLGQSKMDYGMLAGKNWTVNCGSRDACMKLEAGMGGSVTAPLG